MEILNGVETVSAPDIVNPDIDGGTIDGTTIGGTTPAAGAFTTLTASTDPTDANGVGDRGFNDARYCLEANNLSDVDNAATAFGNIKQAAAEDATGVVELATTAEVVTGTDTSRAVTAAGVAAKLGSQTDHGVLVGSGSTAAVTSLTVGTNGQVLVGSTGADPVFATITDGEGITTTLGAGTLQIDCEDSSDSNKGIVELATDAEAVTGTDTARTTTPANITARLAAPGAIGGTTPATGSFTTLNLTGGQIAFPATQSASAGANTLDDYEEGTWTPDLQFGDAKVDITYSVQIGYYVKIGSVVYFMIQMTLSSKGSSEGTAKIYGLPFTSGQVGGCSLWYLGITYTGMIQNYISSSATNINLYDIQEDSTLAVLDDTNFSNTSRVWGVGFYLV